MYIHRTLMVTSAIGLALSLPCAVNAQESDEVRNLDEIVVTGTASSNVTALESSVAITTIDADTLQKLATPSLAKTLEAVPGLWVESSGGEVNNNVAPRGLRGGFSYSFISSQEDGVSVIYDTSFTPDQIQRPDITLERVEAIRGGSSNIFSNNGAGATINYISKKGTETPQGQVRLTVSDFGTFRPEFVYQGPLSDDWLFSVGGYYRVSDGVRDVGFQSDNGGQIRATLTRKLNNGRWHFGVKAVDENNIFHTPTILNNPDDPESIPGLDGSRGSLVGPDLARHSSLVPGREDTDLRDGSNNNTLILTSDLELELGNNLTFSNKTRFTDHTEGNNALFTLGGSTVNAVDFVNGNSDPTVQDTLNGINGSDVEALFGGSAALRNVSTGEIISDSQLATLNGNGLVVNTVNGFFPREYTEFQNDLRLVHETERNTFAAGLIFTNVDHQIDINADRILSDVRDQAQRLDLVSVDAAGNVLGSFTDNGTLEFGTWYSDTESDLTSYSFYANNEFLVTPDLRIDAGIRVESLELGQIDVVNSGQTPVVGALNEDGSDTDNVFANNFIQNGPTTNFSAQENDLTEVAWTVGFNYTVNDNHAIYGRWADGFQTPAINNINSAVQELSFGEFGYRYQGNNLSLSGTLFHTEFNSLNVAGEVTSTGIPLLFEGESTSTGVELEVDWEPIDLFSLNIVGVLQDAELGGFPDDFTPQLNGNRVQRTPDEQLRVSPAVHLFDNRVDLFGTIQYIGERAGDEANTVIFPSYTTLDLGVSAQITDDLSLVVRGNNLTNSLGLTEGNPRAGLTSDAAPGGIFIARPILGRNVVATLTYSF